MTRSRIPSPSAEVQVGNLGEGDASGGELLSLQLADYCWRHWQLLRWGCRAAWVREWAVPE